MATTETPSDSKQADGIFTTSVGTELAALILKDAKSEDRSASSIIRRICERHYAPQLKKLRAAQPATIQLRRAA